MIYIYMPKGLSLCVSGGGSRGMSDPPNVTVINENFFNNLIVPILRIKMKILISTRKWTFTNCSLLPAKVFLFNSLIAVILQIKMKILLRRQFSLQHIGFFYSTHEWTFTTTHSYPIGCWPVLGSRPGCLGVQ